MDETESKPELGDSLDRKCEDSPDCEQDSRLVIIGAFLARATASALRKHRLNSCSYSGGRAMSPLTGPKAPSQLHGLALVRTCSQECDSRPPKTERRRPQSIVWASLAFKVALLLTLAHASLAFSAFATCTAPKNPIEAENCLPGTPPSQWYIPGAGSPNIQGFATDISVNAGQTIFFKVSTNTASYRIDVYRLGYYQGQGARLVASVLPSALLPQVQPPCLTDSSTGLIDCGNWAVSASWAVPSTATSGLYFAVLTRLDTGDQSTIVFVVRKDSTHSNILAQTSDLNWQAYNQYGGNSLYAGGPAGRAYKVSYNRPFVANLNAWLFEAEYPFSSNHLNIGYSASKSHAFRFPTNGRM